jgi:hypothetical protein
VTDQCEECWDTLRCQLIDGHESAHAAQVGDALHSWKPGIPAEFANRLVLDWAHDLD